MCCVWECTWCLWCGLWCSVVGGRGVFGVCVWCAVRVVRHAEKTWKKTACGFRHASVCTFKTSLCVQATSPHVRMHVDVAPVHTGTFRTQNGQQRVIMWPQRFTKRNERILNHYKFKNRSRRTCSRFLQSFALPDEAVKLQLS